MKSRKRSKMGVFLLLSVFALMPKALLAAGDAYVQFFEDKDFKGSALTINIGTDVPDMKSAATDDGKTGFNDKASSVKYEVPPGWQGVIYDDANFQKRIYVLKGTGEMKDLSKASDKLSSFRWEQH